MLIRISLIVAILAGLAAGFFLSIRNESKWRKLTKA